MSETYLGRYAAIQKRNAVAAVLDMSEEEWESSKALREADTGNSTKKAMSNDNDNIIGMLEVANEAIVVDSNAKAV
jgi:hypothetical protein